MIPGKKLREIREAQDVTQHEIAEQMGISDARVSVIESERRGPAEPTTAARYLQAIENVIAERQDEDPGEIVIEISRSVSMHGAWASALFSLVREKVQYRADGSVRVGGES